jgi:hypothetical protein
MEGFNNILQNWNYLGTLIAGIAAGIGVAIILYHLVKLSSIRDKKHKYDYINRSEIDLLWYATIAFIAGIAVFINTIAMIEPEPVWFFVRLFVTIMFALIVGVIAQNLLRFYYPFYVEKRLKKLRFSPRVNPENGNYMKLLSEEEEDVHLDEGMQAEENMFSIDYDVWIDEATGFTKIEKYNGHLHALQCPECSYQTFKVKKEEIIIAPTTSTEGELVKFYSCAYCGNKAKKAFKVAPLEQEVSQPLAPAHRVAGA